MKKDFGRGYEYRNKSKELAVFVLLFAATFVTCMISGTNWAGKNFFEVSNWYYGVEYAILILFFLTAHEFGHYIAAAIHKVDATLPYYIPFPFTFTINFGTFGAVIRTRAPIPSRKALFDIGVAGPIAGFLVCLFYLLYGFITLPSIDFLYSIHPEYLIKYGGSIPNAGLYFGDTILYSLLKYIFADASKFIPPMNEMYHYPFLNVGWFGLFVTSLNMLPLGQLDGGHAVYAMFGKKVHNFISDNIFRILLIIGIFAALGNLHLFFLMENDNGYFIAAKEVLMPVLDFIHLNAPFLYKGWAGWLIWALLSKFFLKLHHPPVNDETELNTGRKILGYFTFVILFLSFSYNGIYYVE